MCHATVSRRSPLSFLGLLGLALAAAPLPAQQMVIYNTHAAFDGNNYVGSSSTGGIHFLLGNFLDPATYLGVTSGDGAVRLTSGSGLGVIRFTGANTYTGDTYLSGYAIFELGNGGSSGSIVSPMVWMDRAFLRFRRSDNFVFSSDTSGTGEIRQMGTGTAIITGNVGLSGYVGSPMNLAGNVTIASGALQIGYGGTTGSVSADIVNNSSLIFDRSNAYSFGHVISGSGAVTKRGAGTLTLGATNTYSGGTTIDAGLVAFSSLANLGSGSITLNGGGLQWANGSTVDVSPRLAALGAAGATFDTNGNQVAFASALSGSGGLTKTGAGTLSLAATNTYSGGTFVNAGLIAFHSLASFGSGSITLNGGGLQWANGNTADVTAAANFNRTLGAAGATFDTNGNHVTFASALSGSGGLTKTGAGTLTLAAVNTHSGGTTVSAGTLQIGAGGTTGSVSGNITNNASVAFNRSDAVTYAGVISGSGSLVHAGAGTTTFTATQTHTGGTVINAGSLVAGRAGEIGTFAAGTLVTVNAAGTLVVNGDSLGWGTGAARLMVNGGTVTSSSITGTHTTLRDLTMTGGVLTTSGTGRFLLNGPLVTQASNTTATIATRLELLANAANPTAFTVAAGTTAGGIDLALSGIVHGSGALVKNGAGTLRLTTTNSYSGGTLVNAGLINFNSLANFGSGSITLNGGGLQWASGHTTDVTAAAQFNRTLGAAGGTFDTNGNNITFASALSGSGGLTKTGAGTLTLATANTHSGGTTVSGGSLAFSGHNRISASSTLYVAGGGTLDLGGTTQTVAGAGSASNRLTGAITAGTLASAGAVFLQGGTYANDWTGTAAGARVWIGGDAGATVTLTGTNDRVYTVDHNQVIIGHSTTGAAGTVKLGHANALAAATENVEVWAGTLDLNGQANVRAQAITLIDDHASNLVNNNTASAASYAGMVYLNNDNYGGSFSNVGGSGQLTLSGTLVGTWLNKTGSGTLTLANDSFFTNSTYPTVDYGRQIVLSGGTLALGGNTTQLNFGHDVGFTFKNNTTLRFSTSGDATYTGGYYATTGAYEFLRFETTGQNITLENSTLTSYGLQKTGAGTLTLASTGAGSTNLDSISVSGGTLALTRAGQLGRYGFLIYSGATLDLGGTTQTVLSDGSSYIEINGGTLANGTLAYDGEIYVYGAATLDATFTGSGNDTRLWLDDYSGGTISLGGSNDRVRTSDHNQVIIGYSQAGTVKLLTLTALAAVTENVEVWNGRLDLNGQAGVRANSLVLKEGPSSGLVNGSTASAASFAGGVMLSTGSAQLGGAGNLRLSGVLSGTGGFTKIDAGTLTLSGTNTYTGATHLNAGTLRVNGSLANTAVTVGSGATLGGSGSLGGLATFASGAHLAPGNSPGMLTFTNGLTLNDGTILDFELGSTSDLIRVSGGLLTGAAGAGGITLNLTNAGGFAANTYVLFDFTGAALSGFDVADFTLGSTIAGYSYSLALNGSSLELTATGSAIPEPSTYAALAGLAALGLAIVRRRQRLTVTRSF